MVISTVHGLYASLSFSCHPLLTTLLLLSKMWETGLLDEISLKIYDALAYHVNQANFNRRIKTVSVWSLQMTANAVLSALRGVVDPMSIRVREAYLKSQEEEGQLYSVEL